jgi:hypothetical protein
MQPTRGYAAKSKTSPLAPFSFERMLKSDVKYRFVIDLATLK